MKKLLSIILASSSILFLFSCSNSSSTSTSSFQNNTLVSENLNTEPKKLKTITDHEDVEMQIPEEINRIVVGGTWPLPSALSVYLGNAQKIVGIHPASLGAAKSGLLGEVFPEILNARTDFINDSSINIEELLKLNPDIVLGVSKDDAEAIRKSGIPAVTFSTSKWDGNVIETYDQWNYLFDEIFGESNFTKNISDYSKDTLANIKERVSSLDDSSRKKVLILHRYDNETMTTSGSKHFGEFWIDSVGGINVANNLDGNLLNINMEQVYEWNPDVVILTNFSETQPEDLYNNKIGGDDWSSVNAIKNNRVYKMPLGLYRTYTPGADTPVTLNWFAKTIYPELFEDINIEEVTKSYYKNYYGIEMSDKQIENMYNPPRSSADGA